MKTPMVSGWYKVTFWNSETQDMVWWSNTWWSKEGHSMPSTYVKLWEPI